MTLCVFDLCHIVVDELRGVMSFDKSVFECLC